MPITFPLAVQLVAALATSMAAVNDVRFGTIPNRLTLPLLLAAPLVHWLVGGPGALLAALLGAFSCALVPLLLFAARALGGGDLKLLTALGALLGPILGMRVELAGFILAAGLAIVQLSLRGQLLASLYACARLLWAPLLRRRPRHGPAGEPTTLRFGPPLCAATLLVLLLEHLP